MEMEKWSNKTVQEKNASWRIIKNINNQNKTSNPKLGHMEMWIQEQNKIVKAQGNVNGCNNIENVNPTDGCCSKWLQIKKQKCLSFQMCKNKTQQWVLLIMQKMWIKSAKTWKLGGSLRGSPYKASKRKIGVYGKR